MDTFYTTSRPQIKLFGINFQRCPGANNQRCPHGHQPTKVSPRATTYKGVPRTIERTLPNRLNSSHHKTIPILTRLQHDNASPNGILRRYDITTFPVCKGVLKYEPYDSYEYEYEYEYNRLTSSYLSYRLLAYYSLQCSRQQSQQSLL